MILIVDMTHKDLGFYEFVLPICKIVGVLEVYEVKHYTEVEKIEHEKVILSGTALKDNEYLKNMESFEWLKTCSVPVLGICAGMQVIGLVFNSLVISCKEIGMTEVKTVRENPLFSLTFPAYELHNYGIDPSDDFEVLAVSERCIQGIKHKKRDIYGVLFHPEVRNGDVINRFILHI